MLYRALGLMSGTSMDGIDLAFMETEGEALVHRGPSLFVPYDAAFRSRIEQALNIAASIHQREDRPGNLADLERELTIRHADAVHRFLENHPHSKPDIIGFHGQTILHRPERGLTVQLGDGQLLADRAGIEVVYDMRANDMRFGGQGAPLVPAYHAALAKGLPVEYAEAAVCFVNIGGISNVTFVKRGLEPVAFDSGPGNALIDQWVSSEGGVPFDQDGMIANEGCVARSVVDRYLAHPFFARKAPKSLDRNDFTLDEAIGLELADGARTLAAVSAEAILRAADHMPEKPSLWIICGGGRKNPHILADLRLGAQRSGSKVILAEDVALDGDAMEAEAWAFLAVRAKKDLPLTFPTTTGCRQAVSGGLFATPRSAPAVKAV